MKFENGFLLKLKSYQSKVSHEENEDKKLRHIVCLYALSWMQSHAHNIKKILKPTLKTIMTKDFLHIYHKESKIV